jgi:hypothetical protein
MSGNVVYVGIDVDDVQYHGSALDRQTGEVLSFQCRPTLKGLIGQLDKVRKHFGGVELKLCYEASYVGFSLQRDLLRSRQRLIQQQGDLRRHMLSLLRRNGLHYKAECASKTHWRTHHFFGLGAGWTERSRIARAI